MMNVRRESWKDEVSRMRKPPLPIGIEFYKHMMDKPYYIDCRRGGRETGS